MSKLIFESAKKRSTKKAIEFELDGVTFKFKPPKTSGITVAALSDNTQDSLRAQLNWLSGGLSDEQAKLIKDRLFDASDPLEVSTLLDIIYALLEESTGRPTTPSSG